MTNYFNAYQLKAGQTAIFPGAGDVEVHGRVVLCGVGLAGEASEIVGKVKKVLLDSGGLITDEHRDALSAALRDVAPVRSTACRQLDIGLAMVANQGLAKRQAAQPEHCTPKEAHRQQCRWALCSSAGPAGRAGLVSAALSM